MTPQINKAIARFRNAVEDKAFQGTIPRFESEEAEAAWDAIDVELERAENALRQAISSAVAERTAELEAMLVEAREAVKRGHDAIAEYYRYWTGGETRGSYDGKPERNGLWEARETMRIALAKIGSRSNTTLEAEPGTDTPYGRTDPNHPGWYEDDFA